MKSDPIKHAIKTQKALIKEAEKQELAAAEILRGTGKFSTAEEAREFLASFWEKLTAEGNSKTPPEEKRKAEKLMGQLLREILPPGLKEGQKLELYQVLLNPPTKHLRRELERLQGELEQLRKELKQKDESIKRLEREGEKSRALVKTRAKVSLSFLSSYFATAETLERWEKQMELDLGDGEKTRDNKKDLQAVIIQGYKPLSFSNWQNRAIKGLFNLADQQGASYMRPYIVLDSKAQLYEEILDRKTTKKTKDGYAFKDFSGREIQQVERALEELSNPEEIPQIIIKGTDQKRQKGKAAGNGFFYMAKEPVIRVEYFKGNLTDTEAEKMTEAAIKETGQIRISFAVGFMMGEYWRFLPKDISGEIRAFCPDVKRVTKHLRNFIDYLHKQATPEVRISKRKILMAAKFSEADIKKRGKAYFDRLLKTYYDIAKRSGYLKDYKLDQRGTYELVDVLYLNEGKYYHLEQRAKKRLEAGEEAEKSLPA